MPDFEAGRKAYLKQQYDKQALAGGGQGGDALSMAGPPYWDQASWDQFERQYGFPPYSASELPPTFENCPDWAYERMGLRKPPVTVAPRGV